MGESDDAAQHRPRVELAGALVALAFLGLAGRAITLGGLPPGASSGAAAGSELLVALGALLFAVGIAGVILWPSAVVAVASLELMLGAVAVTLVAGDRRYDQPDGALAALVVVAVGIAQLAIAAGLLRPLLRRRAVADVDESMDPRG
jgi:NADH-quinone oxidoreductase subunit K